MMMSYGGLIIIAQRDIIETNNIEAKKTNLNIKKRRIKK